jgi:hypothetical protein
MKICKGKPNYTGEKCKDCVEYIKKSDVLGILQGFYEALNPEYQELVLDIVEEVKAIKDEQ